MRTRLAMGPGAAAAGILAAAFLAAGCGSGGGEESLTKAEFVRRADVICTDALIKSAEATRSFLGEQHLDGGTRPSKAQEEQLVAGVLLPQIEAEAEKLGDLPPPQGEEDEVGEIVGGIEAVIAKGKADPSSVIGKASPFVAVDAKARAFGLHACGET
jgi:hypothetical protein